jgi:hypothetical protein
MQNRKKRITIVVTDSQLEFIEKIAKKENISVSQATEKLLKIGIKTKKPFNVYLFTTIMFFIGAIIAVLYILLTEK